MSVGTSEEIVVCNDPKKMLQAGLLKMAVGLVITGAVIGGGIQGLLDEGLDSPGALVFGGAFGAVFVFGGIILFRMGIDCLKCRHDDAPVLRFQPDGLVFANGNKLPWSRIRNAWTYHRNSLRAWEVELNIVHLDNRGNERTYTMHTLGLNMAADRIAELILRNISRN